MVIRAGRRVILEKIKQRPEGQRGARWKSDAMRTEGIVAAGGRSEGVGDGDDVVGNHSSR